jgi:hypothetical protein
MGLISDYFARRRLRPVLHRLPHALAKRYGAGKFYNAAQVRTTAGAIGIPPAMLTAALAVTCTESEFIKADPQFTRQRYLAEREEIARLCRIDVRDLDCRFLTSSFRNPIGEAGVDANLLSSSNDP